MNFKYRQAGIALTCAILLTGSSLAVQAQDTPAENHPPVLTPIDTVETEETQAAAFIVEVSDQDSVVPILSSGPLPGSATFTDNGDYTGLFRWNYTTYDDAGTYTVQIYATDGEDPSLMDSMTVQVVVHNVNRPPIVVYRPNQYISVEEMDTLTFLVQGYDFDGVTPLLSILQTIPNFTFVDSGNGRGVLTITPDHTQDGYHRITFEARDGDTANYPNDRDTVGLTFTVIDVPICADINEDGLINIADAVELIAYLYGYDPLPEDITLFDVNGDGNLTISDALDIVYYVFRGSQRPTCSPN
jgi:hypothetical protein